MPPFLKTYIIDAPWRSILLSGLIFAIVAGGLSLFIKYKNTDEYFTGYWYSALAMWFVVGIFTKYVTWRAEGYLERRNARWKKNKK